MYRQILLNSLGERGIQESKAVSTAKEVVLVQSRKPALLCSALRLL